MKRSDAMQIRSDSKAAGRRRTWNLSIWIAYDLLNQAEYLGNCATEWSWFICNRRWL
jgi:hypothetical protein